MKQVKQVKFETVKLVSQKLERGTCCDSLKEREVGEILDGKFGMRWEIMKLES